MLPARVPPAAAAALVIAVTLLAAVTMRGGAEPAAAHAPLLLHADTESAAHVKALEHSLGALERSVDALAKRVAELADGEKEGEEEEETRREDESTEPPPPPPSPPAVVAAPPPPSSAGAAVAPNWAAKVPGECPAKDARVAPPPPAAAPALDAAVLARIGVADLSALPAWVRSGAHSQHWRRRHDTCPATHASSQDLEDIVTYQNYLQGLVGGTVLESGAVDGRRLSVSWMFEDQLDYRAVLIEAAPSAARQIPGNRPNALAFNAALCGRPATLHNIDGGLAMTDAACRRDLLRPEHLIPGNDFAVVGGFIEFMNEVHVRNLFPRLVERGLVEFEGGRVSRLPDPAALLAYACIQAVACEPPAALLRAAGIYHIDFWSLDVEGAESTVLAGFDFSHDTGVTVDVIMVEYGSEQSKLASDAILVAHNYSYRGDGIGANRWYTRGGFV